MDVIQTHIDQMRRDAYRPEFRDRPSDAEVCGLVIARQFEWDGSAILEVAESALKDANFNDEAEKLRQMREVL